MQVTFWAPQPSCRDGLASLRPAPGEVARAGRRVPATLRGLWADLAARTILASSPARPRSAAPPSLDRGPEQTPAQCRAEPLHFGVSDRTAVDSGDTGGAALSSGALCGVSEKARGGGGQRTGTRPSEEAAAARVGLSTRAAPTPEEDPGIGCGAQTAFTTLTRKPSQEAELRPNAIRSSNA